ncbi:GFA family protein [Granulosicoccus sp. 3-233]|uniref:GFA family protein n=1 Tax=Granulosicoccus sp. 3-233 TaxID=3417969 RepID=UPI003D32CA85
MTAREGGCACGQIRFRIDAPLLGVGICHCRDCQKSSGGAPNYVALAPESGFHVLQGEPRIFSSKSDSGTDAKRAFCPDCGTPLWSHPPDAPFVPVKLGALDDSSDLQPGVHIFVDSAPPWHLMHDGLPQFPKMPPVAPPENES